jgi:hypothetical protein
LDLDHQAASVVEGHGPSQRRLLGSVVGVADEPQELGVPNTGAVLVYHVCFPSRLLKFALDHG